MDIRNEHTLQIVKNIYDESIKIRSGANVLKYRLHHKSGLLKLINDINEHIRNSNRLVQLNKLCYNFDSSWLSEFFNSNGIVIINSTNT